MRSLIKRQGLVNAPKVICQQCCKEVDNLEWFEDHEKGGWRYIAKCHGEIDECFIPWKNLIDLGSDFNILCASAFNDKKQIKQELKTHHLSHKPKFLRRN